MQFTIDAKRLKAALGKVKRATDRKPNMPILENVSIEARVNGVTFAATDLELAISATVETPVETQGETLLPLVALQKLTKGWKGAVHFVADTPYSVAIGCFESGTAVSLVAKSRDEYPILPESPLGSVEILAQPLREALETVVHACSVDETRYNLNGVYLEPGGRAVATDGHRLAVADFDAGPLPWVEGIIVPLKAVKALTALLKKADIVLAVSSAKFMHISGDDWFASIRLIEGEFPNYQQVVPKAIGETVKADSGAFLSALATINQTAPERSHAVKIVLNGGMELHTSNPDLGESRVDCPCSRSGGDLIEVGFNGRYLEQAIGAVCDSELYIGFAAATTSGRTTYGPETSPIRISGSNPDRFAVVMPMRL
jgi:DNA polymerase-3 subunit beta